MNIPEYLVWIDCEMTGLNPEADCLVEIAVVITDFNLNVVDEGLDLVIKPRPESLAGMGDYVRNMHTESGLINEIADGIEMSDAEAKIMAYLNRYAPEAGKSPLAGNSVGVDRLFINRDLPKVAEHIHYRTVDVSSIKELARRWYPKVYFAAPKKDGNHRALGDIQDSIEELEYYRANIFIPN